MGQIQQLPEYNALLAKSIPEVAPLLNQHIGFMIEETKSFQEPAYELVTQEDGTKKIGYKDQDSVNCTLRYGYRTAFAYLYELSRNPGVAPHLDEALSILIPCGCFSYAEIPQRAFDCVMGVTGL